MRAVVQRVSSARVEVGGEVTGSIAAGLVILLGVSRHDTELDAEYLAAKIANLRIFPDAERRMNLSLLDIGGTALVVSQFTLYGDTRKGRRPSYDEAARPEDARKLYEFFVLCMQSNGIQTAQGVFQASMSVHLVNEGPVTLICESVRIEQRKSQ